MLLFAQIMKWLSALMFIVSIGFDIQAIATGAGIHIATWAILTATFAIQYFTWGMNIKSEQMRRETQGIYAHIR